MVQFSVAGLVQFSVTVNTMNSDPDDSATLEFSGPLIRANRQDGPYYLHNLLVYHRSEKFYTEAIYVREAYETAAYSWQDFDDDVGSPGPL